MIFLQRNEIHYTKYFIFDISHFCPSRDRHCGESIFTGTIMGSKFFILQHMMAKWRHVDAYMVSYRFLIEMRNSFEFLKGERWRSSEKFDEALLFEVRWRVLLAYGFWFELFLVMKIKISPFFQERLADKSRHKVTSITLSPTSLWLFTKY